MAPSPQLQAFIDAIPFANDGDVISPSITTRCARAGADRAVLDDDQLARVVTQTYTPVLLARDGGPAPWRIGEGFAKGPTAGTAGEGWMPVALPGGAPVDALTVTGKRPTNVASWTRCAAPGGAGRHGQAGRLRRPDPHS